MTFSFAVGVTFGALVVIALTSCNLAPRSPEVAVEVKVGAKGHLMLIIENPTAHLILFDDPRFSPTARFDWELFSGQQPVGASRQSQPARDPLIAGHRSTGPVDIGSNRPLTCDLSE